MTSGHSSRTIRQNKNDLAHDSYYNFPEFWTGGSTFKNKSSVFKKIFINEQSAVIFNYDEFKDLSKLGELDQAEKELDKDVLEIKSLVNKIGDSSKIILHQKNFFLYDESNHFNQTFYKELHKYFKYMVKYHHLQLVLNQLQN